jgi:hypothetical protein
MRVRERAVDGWYEGAGGRLDDPAVGIEDASAGLHPAGADARESEVDLEPDAPEHEVLEPEVDPDPEADDPEDELFLLGERCAHAYMQADALHYRAMKLLVEFDRREAWKDTGFSSTAEWLTWRIGIKLGAARERLRTALALEELPAISEAMKNGELSFSKTRALTRVATADNETALLDFALAGSAANLERMVSGWKAMDRKSEVTAEQIRYRSRRLSAFVDTDGMVVVRGRLDPETGALFMRAVEAASDSLFRQTSSDAADGAADDGTPATDDAATDNIKPEQRRADALGLMAERALAAGFRNADGDEVVSGSRAERYQVMLHVEAGTLEEDGEAGQSELEDGTRVSAETSRRIACDAGLVTITHAPDGSVMGAGRRSRTIPPSLRRALEARDRGCRFPGCGLRFTDVHHVKHWADGGETSLSNTALLCKRHHRAVHEGGVRICIDVDGQVVFFTPRGKALFDAPRLGGRLGAGRAVARRPIAGDPAPGRPGDGRREDGGEPLRLPGLDDDLELGPLPDHYAGAALWTRDYAVPWAIEARAWEALDSEPLDSG